MHLTTKVEGKSRMSGMCFQKHPLEPLQVLFSIPFKGIMLRCTLVGSLMQERNHSSISRKEPKGGGTIIFRWGSGRVFESPFSTQHPWSPDFCSLLLFSGLCSLGCSPIATWHISLALVLMPPTFHFLHGISTFSTLIPVPLSDG